MKKVAIYCRLSDEDTDKKYAADESESIQNQKSMLLTYAMEMGWCVYNIYCDEDYSGIDRNRPDFIRMINDCEKGKIDIVLCKTQSRFSRDMEIIEKYLHNKFIEWGIRFIGLVDNADTDVESNKKARQINGLINEWYLEDASINIRKTLNHKKKKGEYTGPQAPYGYFKDPHDKHRFIIDPVASKVVKTMFDLYLNGYGYTKIAQYLNGQIIMTPYYYKKELGLKIGYGMNATISDKWNANTIRYMIKDETYIGNLVQGKRQHISYKNSKSIRIPKEDWIIVPNTHEPIIDMDTWNAIQERLKNIYRPQKDTGEIQMFAQKVFCMECDNSFKKKSSNGKNGKVFKYLACKSRQTGDFSCMNNKGIIYEDFENIVLNEINLLLNKYYNEQLITIEIGRLDINKSKLINVKDSLNTEKANLNKTLKSKEQCFKSLYEDKIKGIITDDEFIELSETFRKEISNVSQRIHNIELELAHIERKEAKKDNRNEILCKYKQIEKLDRNILDEFIERIEVGNVNESKNREINIMWAI